MLYLQSLSEIIESLAHSMEKNENLQFETTALSVLSKTQIHYLDTIHHLGNPTLSELAKILNVTKPTSTIAIEKLTERGYVIKVPSDSDRRSSHVHLTESGERMAALHDDSYRIYAGYFRDSLNENEIQDLIQLLGKVINKIKSKTQIS